MIVICEYYEKCGCDFCKHKIYHNHTDNCQAHCNTVNSITNCITLKDKRKEKLEKLENYEKLS